jgi:hypothetical protein
MSRVVTLDLDDANDVARAWAEVERVLTIRNAEPETRQNIERLLPLVDDEARAEIERVLDDVPPIVILRVPELLAALVEANHREQGPGCMARSEVGRAT